VLSHVLAILSEPVPDGVPADRRDHWRALMVAIRRVRHWNAHEAEILAAAQNAYDAIHIHRMHQWWKAQRQFDFERRAQ
jgi:hypothetical protein